MKKLGLSILIGVATLGSASPAQAGARDQALRVFNRITGVHPTDAELDQMEQRIAAGNYKQAAQMATSSFHFYNTNLVRWAHALSNRDESPRPDNGENSRVPLNDYVATIIGIIRDNVSFDQVLYGDIIYTGAPGLANVAAFAFDSNTHYQNLGSQISQFGGLDLSQTTTLVRQSQTALRTGIPDVAGVLTTRKSAAEFFSAGTNRRPLRYAFKEFLCIDPAEIMDAAVPDGRVRRDVDRAPTGNAKVYLTSCKGCHAGMDGLAGAFAFFDFNNNALTYNATQVAGKINRTTNYPDGYRTTDDSWVNLWMSGANARLGWKPDAAGGKGANSLGRALASTRQFSACMAKRAFKLGCMREPLKADEADVSALADAFERGGYNMKSLIEDAATLQRCRGQ